MPTTTASFTRGLESIGHIGHQPDAKAVADRETRMTLQRSPSRPCRSVCGIERDAERLFEVLPTSIIIRKLLEESHDPHQASTKSQQTRCLA
jgi:hypothetical protein